MDRNRGAGFGVVEMELGRAEQHAGMSKLFGDLFVEFHVAVEVITNNGVAGELKVLADLMKAPGVRGGFNQAEFWKVGKAAGRVGGDAFEIGEGGALFFVIGSAQRGVGLPLERGFAVDDGSIFFGYLAVFEKVVRKAQAGLGEGEKQDAGGGAIEAVDGVDFLSELIAQDLHGDLIVRFTVKVHHERLGGARLVDENPGGLIDGNESVVLIENLKRVHLHSA